MQGIDKIHYELLDNLKKDMEKAFPQLRIINTNTSCNNEKYQRLYFSIYNEREKHKWGQVRMVTYEKYQSDTIHHFIAMMVEDYRPLKSEILDTNEQVIDFFSKYIEKKSNIQLSIFDIV